MYSQVLRRQIRHFIWNVVVRITKKPRLIAVSLFDIRSSKNMGTNITKTLLVGKVDLIEIKLYSNKKQGKRLYI